MDKIYGLFNSMSLYVRRAWDSVMPVNWDLPDRIIFDFEIVYIMSGQAIITIGDIEYSADVGDVFFFRPMTVHSIHGINNTALRQPHVHFDFFYSEDSEEVYIPVWSMTDPGEDIKYARPDISGPGLLNIPDKITPRDPSIVENLIFSLIKEEDSTSVYSVLRQKALLFELLAYLFTESDRQQEEELASIDLHISETLESARNFIIQNFNRTVSLDDIAQKAGFSPNYFSMLFRQHFGMTPVQYHTNVRIGRAKHLLVLSEAPITEIALQLGFESIHSFSRVFKRETGVSPMYFRQITKKGR